MNDTNTVERYSRESLVTVMPFTCQYEGDEAIIGRLETGTFLSVPRQAVDVLEFLAEGKTVGEAAESYRERYGELPDVGDFLVVLEAKGLVEPNDGTSATGKTPGILVGRPKKRYHLAHFPQPLAARIFSSRVIYSCVALIAIATFLFITDGFVRPAFSDIYFSDHRTIIFLFLVFVSYGSVVIHEIAHLIAARSIGVNARIGFGNRLYDLVVETDLTGLWSVPKRQRYLPLMAGCLLDALVSALLIFMMFAQEKHLIALQPLTLHIWKAILLTYVTRVFWQWFLFVRTDYYYILATWLNCKNLLGDTEAFVKNQIARLIPQVSTVDQTSIPARERQILPYFSVIWVAGRILALYWLYKVTGPIILHYLHDLVHSLEVGYSVNPDVFWDSLMLVFLMGVPIIVGGVMWIRSIVARSWFAFQRSVQHG